MSTGRSRLSRIVACTMLIALPAAGETFPVGPVQVEIPTSKERASCFSTSGGSDGEMATCEANEAAVWDRRLNAAWARLRASLPPAEMARLQTAQRGWIAYRDHECRRDPDAGTAGGIAAASCILRLTATRAAELEARVASQ
jgi:uncharacterized protein YecT (DUF1311 family)